MRNQILQNPQNEEKHKKWMQISSGKMITKIKKNYVDKGKRIWRRLESRDGDGGLRSIECEKKVENWERKSNKDEEIWREENEDKERFPEKGRWWNIR